jgi:hypothetical protein
VEQLATLAGTVGDRFEKGAELLQEMAGVRLSESTVERTTEDVGQRIEEHLKGGTLFGEPTAWDWHRDAKGRSAAYFSIDATGTRQQGQNAAKAEGRMAAVLRNEPWPPRQSAALREQRGKVERYFENNLSRMAYPEYQAEGWQIGSGVVESVCKTVVGQRLKGAGVRWGETGAQALYHIRVLYRSEKGHWQAFWQRRFTHRSSVHQPK